MDIRSSPPLIGLAMTRARSNSKTRVKSPRSGARVVSRSPEPLRAEQGTPVNWMRSNGLWNLPNVLSMARVILIPVPSLIVGSAKNSHVSEHV